MRLLALAVRDFRGLDERRIELLDTGVTILEGPNEAGKTSLAEAVELLFERHDSSTHADVREAQPVGRDVGPEVEVEAVAGACRFRYRKRFLKRPETVLEVLEPVAESLTGREAHDRVAELLGAAGVDRELWKALRVVQGGGVAQPDGLAASPSLLDALGAAAAAEDGGAEEGAAAGGRHPVDLHRAVIEEHGRYFTEKRRTPSGELAAARDELASAEAEAGALAAEMEALEEDAGRAVELERRQVELRGAVAAAEEESRGAAAEAERVAGLETEAAGLRAAVAEEEATVELLRELAAARRAVAELGGRLAAARDAEARARRALAPADEAARRSVAALAAAEGAVEAAHRRARLAERLAARREALAELEARAVRVEAAQGRASAAAARLAELPPVGDEALAALEGLESEAQRLEAGLEAASPRLEVTARADLRLRVVDGGAGDEGSAEGGGGGGGEQISEREDEAVELPAGRSWQRRPAAPLTIEIPGVAGITVAPGSDAEALRRRLEEARRGSARRCRELGVASLEAARAAHRDRRAAEGERRAAEAELAGVGGDEGDAVQVLERRRAALVGEVADLERGLTAMPSPEPQRGDEVTMASAGSDSNLPLSPASGPAAQPGAAEAAVESAEAGLAAARRDDLEARRRREERQRALDAARGTLRELEIELRNAEDRRRRVGDRATGLLRRRREDGAPLQEAIAGSQADLAPPPVAKPSPPEPEPEAPVARSQLALFAAVGAAAARGPLPAHRAPAEPPPFADRGSDPSGTAVSPADPLPAALAAAEERATAARDGLAAARRRLGEARPDAVRRRAAGAAASLDRLRREQRAAEDEHLAVRTRLETAGDRAVFERLEEARGRLAAARRAAASVEARAAAAARLLAAVEEARETARRTYSEPLARTVEELGRPLFGDGFAVELDERLHVARRTAFGVTLEYARLSTGAQEQLALLLRLACAVLVSPAEGVPLIVDDALGHTDPARLQALGEVLSRVGRRCQVLILTCFPERYAEVAGARRIRLGDLAATTPENTSGRPPRS